jgi:hypothetical protein
MVVTWLKEKEARFANSCIPDLFMRCRPDPRSSWFHREYVLRLPAVLREDPAPEKHPVGDGIPPGTRETDIVRVCQVGR